MAMEFKPFDINIDAILGSFQEKMEEAIRKTVRETYQSLQEDLCEALTAAFNPIVDSNLQNDTVKEKNDLQDNFQLPQLPAMKWEKSHVKTKPNSTSYRFYSSNNLINNDIENKKENIYHKQVNLGAIEQLYIRYVDNGVKHRWMLRPNDISTNQFVLPIC